MARRINLSQFKSQLRKLEQQNKNAIRDVNREISKYNRNVKKAVNDYNREVRNYNSKVRANRQKIHRELNRLKNSNVSSRYTVYVKTVYSFNDAYERINEDWERTQLTSTQQEMLEYFEQENLNSLSLMNILTGNETDETYDSDDLQSSRLDELISISSDLDKRWRGALFSLNPVNPDAARHFCTSSREILNQIIETTAPDELVFEALPDCAKTERGNPTRRSKIKYLLTRKGLTGEAVEEFVEQDIKNIHELFRIFNDGTHGSAGKFEYTKLKAIKKRVEDGILFLIMVAK